jgi:hypothetical protein
MCLAPGPDDLPTACVFRNDQMVVVSFAASTFEKWILEAEPLGSDRTVAYDLL